MYKSSLELLQRNLYILFIDYTYKINRFNMPLLDIMGSTAINTTFYMKFAFLSNEKQESYEFILGNLHNIY
jgi:hypothetical protein